jgi:flagellar biosynthetic protein FliR
MATLHLPLADLLAFMTVFIRTAAVVMSIPVFGGRALPVLLKAGMVLAVSLLIYPRLTLPPLAPAVGILPFVLGLAAEVMLGAAIGLCVNMLFAGVQLAGEIAGYQMGLAIANVLDPDSSEQIPLLSQVYQIFAVLIFVSVNGHYHFLGALTESFQRIPPFGFQLSGTLMEQLVGIGRDVFVIGIKVGAPVIVVLLLTSVAFGLIARTVPQMNVFLVAIPLKIAVGLLFVCFSLPFFSAYLQELFAGLGTMINVLLASGK